MIINFIITLIVIALIVGIALIIPLFRIAYKFIKEHGNDYEITYADKVDMAFEYLAFLINLRGKLAYKKKHYQLNKERIKKQMMDSYKKKQLEK